MKTIKQYDRNKRIVVANLEIKNFNGTCFYSTKIDERRSFLLNDPFDLSLMFMHCRRFHNLE